MAKYSKQIVDKICELVASGDYKIVDLCKKAGIHHDTYYDWKANKPEFSERLKKAEEERLEAFKSMARSGLAKLLDVYEYEEIHEEFSTDIKGNKRLKSIKVVTRRIMPNPAAVIFALCNLEPENFKNIQRVDHTSKGEQVTGFNYIQPNEC